MKDIVTRFLEDGGAVRHDRWLALRLGLLTQRLQSLSCQFDSHIDKTLDLVGNASLQQLVSQATPFLWFNVHAAFDQSASTVSPNWVESFCSNFFDSYFNFLDDGACVSWVAQTSSPLILPALGMKFPPAPDSPVQLTRVDRNTLEFACNGSRIKTQIEPIPTDLLAGIISIPGTDARLFFEPSGSCLGQYAKEVLVAEEQTKKFPTTIAQALDTIRRVYPQKWLAVNNLIKWFVPYPDDDSAGHRSHSSRDHKGVIFSSAIADATTLAIGIIHEYQHNQLDLVAAIEPFVHRADNQDLFYSPWRDDPRPLMGLIHGIHAFLGVAEFLLLLTNERTNEVPLLQQEFQLRKTMYQLRTALQQIPPERLKPFGKQLYIDFQTRLLDLERQVDPLPNSIPQELSEKLEEWKARNPTLKVHRG